VTKRCRNCDETKREQQHTRRLPSLCVCFTPLGENYSRVCVSRKVTQLHHYATTSTHRLPHWLFFSLCISFLHVRYIEGRYYAKYDSLRKSVPKEESRCSSERVRVSNSMQRKIRKSANEYLQILSKYRLNYVS